MSERWRVLVAFVAVNSHTKGTSRCRWVAAPRWLEPERWRLTFDSDHGKRSGGSDRIDRGLRNPGWKPHIPCDTRDMWCPGQDSNLHVPEGTADFKSAAAANFATRAVRGRLSRYPPAHSETMRSSVVSGTRPEPSTVSWKPLMSKLSPSDSSASRRIR